MDYKRWNGVPNVSISLGISVNITNTSQDAKNCSDLPLLGGKMIDSSVIILGILIGLGCILICLGSITYQ